MRRAGPVPILAWKTVIFPTSNFCIHSCSYLMRRKGDLELDMPVSIFLLGDVGRPPSGLVVGPFQVAWFLSLYRAYRKTEQELDVGSAKLPPACCQNESRVRCQNATAEPLTRG